MERIPTFVIENISPRRKCKRFEMKLKQKNQPFIWIAGIRWWFHTCVVKAVDLSGDLGLVMAGRRYPCQADDRSIGYRPIINNQLSSVPSTRKWPVAYFSRTLQNDVTVVSVYAIGDVFGEGGIILPTAPEWLHLCVHVCTPNPRTCECIHYRHKWRHFLNPLPYLILSMEKLLISKQLIHQNCRSAIYLNIKCVFIFWNYQRVELN